MSHQELPVEDRPIPERIDLHAKKKLSPWTVAAIVAGVIAAAFAALCVYVNTLDTIFPNTTIHLANYLEGPPVSVDVSGMTVDEVTALCVAPEGQTTILRYEGEAIATPTLTELGISIDAEATAQLAYDACRGDHFLATTVTYVKQLFVPLSVSPLYTLDENALAAAAEEMRLTVANEVVDGAWELVEGEGLYLTKPRDGLQIDAEALCKSLKTELLGSHQVFYFNCPFARVEAVPLSVADIHEELSGTVQESRYDKETGEASASRVGVDFDVAAVSAQLEAAEPGARFLADAEVTFPKVSQEFLQENMFRDVLGTATTKVTGTWSRINNVKLSAAAINGKVYNPGQEFWYNYTVGERTEAKGYGAAPSYAGGKTIDSVGGGICQTSSTLYLAQLNANLKTVLRYCHQFVPAYILWGCDATVSWGGCDYAFRNNTDYPIKIVTEWSDDNELTVSILGTKMDDTYVEMTNQVLSSTSWNTRYVINDQMEPYSEPVEVQTPYTGYYVKAYRNVYAGDGTLLSSTLESTSDYESRDRIYEVDYYTYVDMFGMPTAEETE